MPFEREKRYWKFTWRKVLQYFFQGVIVLAPIAITIYAVWWFFNTVDNILPNLINSIFPNILEKDAVGAIKKIPGLGFIVFIVITIITGWLSSLFFVGRLMDFLDAALERIPGIRFVYSPVKDFLEAFAGNKKKFDKPVLVSVDAQNVWRIGFITQKDAMHFDLAEHAVVYIPHSYAISGITYIVPKENVRLINISATEAMKFIMSGGVTDVDHLHITH